MVDVNVFLYYAILMEARRQRGRPKLDEGEAREVVVTFRVRLEDRERMKLAAKAAGETFSEWARKVLISASSGR